MKKFLTSLGKIGLALPIVAAVIIVALDILVNGDNTLLSWIGAPLALVGGYLYLYRISRV